MENLKGYLERLLRSREGVGLLVGISTIAVALLPIPLFAVVLVLFSYLLGWELERITSKRYISFVAPLALLFSLFSPYGGMVFSLSAALVFGYLAVRLKGHYSADTFLTFTLTLLVGIYAGVLPSALFEIKVHSTSLLLALLFAIWTADTLAYYFGKNFGRKPLITLVSPSKTWEGFLGGLVGGTLVGTFLSLLMGTGMVNPLVWLLVVMASVLGDLFESFVKRSYGVKDSSDLLGSHGGLLDRFDALLFAAATLALFL